MKNKTKKLLLLLVTFFSLCSCAPNNCKEFVLMEGDILLINRENGENEILNSSNSKVMECLEENFIKAKRQGETTVSLKYDKQNEELSFKVEPRKIENINESQNEKIEKSLINKINDFIIKSGKKKHLTVEAKTYVAIRNNSGGLRGSLAESTKIKTSLNPLQIEYGELGEEDHFIIRKEEDKFYRYDFSKFYGKFCRSEFAADEEKFKKLYEKSEYYYDVEELMDFGFDKSNSNAYSKDNFYLIHSYYKDCLSDEIKNEFIDLYERLGMNPDYLFNSIATLYYQFEKETVTMGVAMNVEMYNMNAEIGMAFVISTNKFEPFEISEDNAILPRPTSIDLVTKKTEFVGKEFQFSIADDTFSEFIMTDFEKGQYIINHPNGKFDYIDIKIYDKNKNLVESKYIDVYDHTFYIPKKGTYYVELGRSTDRLIRINVEKANYKTIADPNKPEDFESGEYLVEGYMDIHYFEYYNSTLTSKKLLVKNVGNETFMFGGKLLDHIYSGATFEYTLKPGINKFVLSNNIFHLEKEGYPKTYNVEFEIV